MIFSSPRHFRDGTSPSLVLKTEPSPEHLSDPLTRDTSTSDAPAIPSGPEIVDAQQPSFRGSRRCITNYLIGNYLQLLLLGFYLKDVSCSEQAIVVFDHGSMLRRHEI